MTEHEEEVGFIFAIEGLIGVGKSTMCYLLRRHLISEFGIPQDKVVIINDMAASSDLLPKFYENPREYAYQLQRHFENHRFTQLQRAMALKQKGFYVIIDQSLLSDIVFAGANKTNFKDGQWELYLTEYEEDLQRAGPVDLVIYLAANAQTSLKRIGIRGRECESEISLGYLETLEKLYEERFGTSAPTAPSCRSILRIDWSVFKKLDDEPAIRKMKNTWCERGKFVLVSV